MKTITLETAQQLKAAGFPQNAEYYWASGDDNPTRSATEQMKWRLRTKQELKQAPAQGTRYAAPTAEEVLEQLPDRVDQYRLIILKSKGWFTVQYGTVRPVAFSEVAQSLAEAAALLWLDLKKEGILKNGA